MDRLIADPSNAGLEWQARSYCYGSRLDGGLLAPGACSKCHICQLASPSICFHRVAFRKD